MISHNEAQELHRLIGQQLNTLSDLDTPLMVADMERALELASLIVADTEQPVITITKEQAEAWAVRELTDEQIELLDEALPNSSVPDAIATIVDSFEEAS